MGCGSSVTTAEIYLTDKRTLSGGAENKPSALMREPTFGSQSKFRFNLRTDHKIRDIARLYHELKPTLLWVDHNPSVDNKNIEITAAAKGVTVVRCMSSHEAIAFLNAGPLQKHRALPPSKFRIMSNRSRPEGPHMQYDTNAGMTFAHLSRQHGYNGPIMIFCNNVASVDALEAVRLNVIVSSDSHAAGSFASFEPENPRYSLRDAGNMFPNFEALEKDGVKSVRFDGIHILKEDEAIIKSKLASNAIGPADVDNYIRELAQASYTKYYIDRNKLTVSNDTVASNVFRCIENLVLRFSDQTGTLKPSKVSDAFDIGPPVVKRVIAIDNARLRQQFVSAMDRLEARGGMNRLEAEGGSAWDCDDALRVLRMSVPDIQQYRHARPALLFHATNDKSEKSICCMGFRKEFQGSASGVLGMIGNGVYFSTLPMYSTEFQTSERMSPHHQGEVCLLACWVLIGRPHLVKEPLINGTQKADSDTHYALVRSQIGNSAAKPVVEGEHPDGDELCVFDVLTVLPQFVVEVTLKK